jgi:hypothetical protein
MDSINQKINAMNQVMPTTEEIDRRIEELDLDRLKQLVTAVYANDPSPPTIFIHENIVYVRRDMGDEVYVNDKLGMILYLWYKEKDVPEDLTFGNIADKEIKEFIQRTDKNSLYFPTLRQVLTGEKTYLLGFLISFMACFKGTDTIDPAIKNLGATLNFRLSLIRNIYQYFTMRSEMELRCFYLKCPNLFARYSDNPY